MSVMSPAPTPSAHPHPPPAAAGVAESSSAAQIRADLERTLLKLSQDLYEMEICAGDVVAGQEDRVPGYLREIDRGLMKLEEISGRLGDSVPRQVVEAIDRFRNPHGVYTKAALTRATGENQYANGRVRGLENFRRQLEDAVGGQFPEIPLPERSHRPDTGTVSTERSERDVEGKEGVKDEPVSLVEDAMPNGAATATNVDHQAPPDTSVPAAASAPASTTTS